MESQMEKIINDICTSLPALRCEGKTAARGPQDEIMKLVEELSEKIDNDYQIVFGRINSPNNLSVEFHEVSVMDILPCKRLIRIICEERLQHISNEKYEINIENERLTIEYNDHIPISEPSIDGNYLVRTCCHHEPSNKKIIEEYKLRSFSNTSGPSIREHLGYARMTKILENNEFACNCGGELSQMVKNDGNIAHCTRCGEGVKMNSPWTSMDINLT